MDPRRQALSNIFNGFLERYSPPRNMQGNPAVMQQEADALFKVILKFAPAKDYENWLEDVLEQLAYQMKTRAWPTVNEVGSAARNIRKERFQAEPQSAQVVKDPLEVMAERVRAGGPVPDGYLYGRMAVEMVQQGHIQDSELTRHRSSLFFAMKAAWGETPALKQEAAFKQRHAAATDLAKAAQRKSYNPTIPTNPAPVSQDARDEYRAGGWS